METVLIVILLYILSIFFNRWLNKIIYKMNKMSPRPAILWFIPIMGTLFLLVILTMDLSMFLFNKIPKNGLTDWFNGKNW